MFAVTVCISISAFASLVDSSKGLLSSVIGLNICAIIARIRKYKLIIKKKKKKQNKTVLLAKSDLDCIKELPWSLIDSYIERDYSQLIDLLKKYDYMKVYKSINLKPRKLIKIFNIRIKQCHCIVGSVEKCRKEKSKSCKEKKRKNITFIIICSV